MTNTCFMIKCKPRRGKSWLVVTTASFWRKGTIKAWERETGQPWDELMRSSYTIVKVECTEVIPARRTRKKAQS